MTAGLQRRTTKTLPNLAFFFTTALSGACRGTAAEAALPLSPPDYAVETPSVSRPSLGPVPKSSRFGGRGPDPLNGSRLPHTHCCSLAQRQKKKNVFGKRLKFLQRLLQQRRPFLNLKGRFFLGGGLFVTEKPIKALTGEPGQPCVQPRRWP